MNKSNKFFYICLMVIVLLGITGWLYQKLATQKAYNTFLKDFSIQSEDIAYRSKSTSFGGKGLVFYQARLTPFNIIHKIDKLIIRRNENNVIVQMNGLTLNIPETLKEYYGNGIVNAVDSYIPFEDALNKPLISLGLMGYDTVKGDAVFVFNPSEQPMLVNAQIKLPELADIQLSFPIQQQRKKTFSKNLLHSAKGNVSELAITLLDTGLFKKYADYLIQTGDETAQAFAEELVRHDDFTRRVSFHTPVDLSQFYAPDTVR